MPEGHNFKKVEGTTKKGNVVLLHSHTIHGSEPNYSNRFRRSFLAGYSLKGIEFKKGGHMKREPIDIYSLQNKYW
jgi:ectoine hydroxylase-related dioxygenase (phytanoyl-CoA dioxygenase family)